MRNWNNGDNWNFSRWLRNTSRNAKANLAVNTLPQEEVALYRNVVNYFCHVEEEQSSSSDSEETIGTGTYTVGGTRPWLYQRLLDKATSASTDYCFDASVEPDYVIVRALEVIARDLIAIPLSADEAEYLKGLGFMPINGTNHSNGDMMHRAFGALPGAGGVIGSRDGMNTDPRETTFHFNGSPDETYLIEGTLDTAKLIELGLINAGQWIKAPASIEIGIAVTNIGQYAFYQCNELKHVTIPNSVTRIENYAFFRSGLEAIEIPNSIEYIGSSAFSTCANLITVIIPNSVTSIGDQIFGACNNLKSATLGNGLTQLNMMFNNCPALTSVILGNNITQISVWAFGGCKSLPSIVIPKSVTSIGMMAFQSCNSLMSVTMEDKSMETVQNMSYMGWNLPSGCVIHCTDGDITR